MAARLQRKVLHVEDDPGVQALVRATLTRDGGYEVHTAGNGARAIELAVLRSPDLVLLDLDLPDINGEQVLAALRASAATRDIPVVVISGDTDPALHRRVLAGGAGFFLVKPYAITDLLGAVDGSLG